MAVKNPPTERPEAEAQSRTAYCPDEAWSSDTRISPHQPVFCPEVSFFLYFLIYMFFFLSLIFIWSNYYLCTTELTNVFELLFKI
jgi:hypothetical protein